MKKMISIIIGVALLFFVLSFVYLYRSQNTGTRVSNISLAYEVETNDNDLEETFSVYGNKLLILSQQKPLCFVLKNGRPIVALDSSETSTSKWSVYKIGLPSYANEMIATFYDLRADTLKQIRQKEVDANYFSQVDIDTLKRISGKTDYKIFEPEH